MGACGGDGLMVAPKAHAFPPEMLAELGYRTNESGELEETEPRLSPPGGCSREALVTNRGSCADHHAVASLRNSWALHIFCL